MEDKGISGVDYIDLTRKTDDFRVPVAPAFYYLIYSLEIVLADASDTHLLLVHSSYALQGAERRECIWTPPFVAFHAGPTVLAPRAVGQLRKRFRDLEAAIKEEEEVHRALYVMGAVGAEHDLIGEVLEYKRSLREPEKLKCYKIKRYAVRLTDDLALLNAADPEELHGHSFLPLQGVRNIVTKLEPGQSGATYRFRGKPLASHVCALIDNEDELALMKGRAMQVPLNFMQYEEKGILCRVDISGYGRLCEYVRDNMGSFIESGAIVEQWLNGTLYRFFWTELAKCGVTRVRMEGDGFVAAQPLQNSPSDRAVAAVLNFLKVFAGISNMLEQFNRAVHDTGKRVDCRCSLTQGTYRYGRIGQLLASGGELEGSAITEVSRLDQALRDQRMSRSSSENDAVKPTLVIAATLFDSVATLIPDLQKSCPTRFRVSVKELQCDAVLCSYPPKAT